jgi:hypothetical protein
LANLGDGFARLDPDRPVPGRDLDMDSSSRFHQPKFTALTLRRRQNSAWLSPLFSHATTSRCQYLARSDMWHLRRYHPTPQVSASRCTSSSAHVRRSDPLNSPRLAILKSPPCVSRF